MGWGRAQGLLNMTYFDMKFTKNMKKYIFGCEIQ